MKTKVYSVFDSKAAIFGTPFFMPNDKMAIRAFGDLVNKDGTMVEAHPEDFSLFGVGEFDDLVGELVPIMKPVNMCTASSLKKLDFSGLSNSLIGNGIKEVVK